VCVSGDRETDYPKVKNIKILNQNIEGDVLKPNKGILFRKLFSYAKICSCLSPNGDRFINILKITILNSI